MGGECQNEKSNITSSNEQKLYIIALPFIAHLHPLPTPLFPSKRVIDVKDMKWHWNVYVNIIPGAEIAHKTNSRGFI